MATNIDEAIKSIQGMFIEVCGELSSYELSIIENSIRLPMQRAFTSSSAMTDAIQSILSNLTEVNYLRTKLIQMRYEVNLKHRIKYDKQFTLLTRMGRPSKQAIESELYSSDGELDQLRIDLEGIDNLLDYLQTQIELLQSTVRNYESQKYRN